MNLPNPLSLLFLAFLLVLLPLAARRTARRLRGEVPGPPVSRALYWRSAIQVQLLLLLFAWVTGASFDYRIFAVERLRPVDGLLALAAFAVCYALRVISRRARSADELQRLTVYERAPRTRADLALFTAAVVVASVAEEAAYRGVGWAILGYALGSGTIPALVLCAAFALAHWNQGWKSGVTIFALAGVLHVLVALTGTLALAMVVHAAYDLVIGAEIRREARRRDAAAESGREPPGVAR